MLQCISSQQRIERPSVSHRSTCHSEQLMGLKFSSRASIWHASFIRDLESMSGHLLSLWWQWIFTKHKDMSRWTLADSSSHPAELYQPPAACLLVRYSKSQGTSLNISVPFLDDATKHLTKQLKEESFLLGQNSRCSIS